MRQPEPGERTIHVTTTAFREPFIIGRRTLKWPLSWTNFSLCARISYKRVFSIVVDRARKQDLDFIDNDGKTLVKIRFDADKRRDPISNLKAPGCARARAARAVQRSVVSGPTWHNFEMALLLRLLFLISVLIQDASSRGILGIDFGHEFMKVCIDKVCCSKMRFLVVTTSRIWNIMYNRACPCLISVL